MDIQSQAREILFKQQLEDFCSLLNKSSLPFLIFKGSALAYEKYKDPMQRPRHDTDVLIDKTKQNQVLSVLKSAGYEPLPNQDKLLGQKTFKKVCGEATFFYDIHWRLFAPRRLGELFSFEELWSERIKMQSLPAFTLSDRHALAVGGIHWVGHHLLFPEKHWISDIQLLAQGKDASWWGKFKVWSRQKKIQKIMESVLRASSVRSPWEEKELQVIDEDTAYYLKPNRTSFQDARQDFIYLSWLDRIAFLWCHLVPQKEWILTKYASKKKWRLPYFYLRRILEGLFINIKGLF